MSDDRGRPTIADFLGGRGERLYHVGRLDYDTEGLMLLMNDGELAHRLAHPRYGVAKTYLADGAGRFLVATRIFASNGEARRASAGGGRGVLPQPTPGEPRAAGAGP